MSTRAVEILTDRDDAFHHALDGVDKSSRQFDLDSEFHHALGQGVDKSGGDFDREFEHVSDRESV